MFNGLGKDQAVTTPDSMYARFSEGVYEINGERLVVKGWNGQTCSIPLGADIQKIIIKYPKIVQYKLKSGETISKEEYNALKDGIFGQYESGDGTFCYPDTATEIEVKTHWLPYEGAEPIKDERGEIKMPVKLNIVGHYEDPKNPFITTPFMFGEISWGGSGLYRVDIQKATWAVWEELKTMYPEHKYSTGAGERTHLRFAKIDGNYVFSSESNIWEKGSTRVFKTLSEAEECIKSVQTATKLHILTHVAPKSPDVTTINDLLSRLTTLQNTLDNVAPMKKSRGDLRNARSQVEVTIKMLEATLLKEE